MANPFLFNDDLKETNTDTFNPFLMDEGEPKNTENPFVTQTINPFTEYSEDYIQETHINNESNSVNASNTDAMTGIINSEELNDDNINQFSKISHFNDVSEENLSQNEAIKRKEPPTRPNPPSQTTQDLIFAVADQLDQASSQMLGRLPATRTPSPVSMRDIHSPSPFPDLVDISGDNDPMKFQSDGLETEWMDNIDNPFTMNTTDNLQSTILDSVNHKAQPSRPPPPRPVPPPRPNQLVQTDTKKNPNQEPDLFDIFGDEKPSQTKPAPKTKEDILSLFSAPKGENEQNKKTLPDLLSDDIILENIPPVDLSLPAPLTMQAIDQPLISVSLDVAPQEQNTSLEESKQDKQNQIETEVSGPENYEPDIETKKAISEENAMQDQNITDSIAPKIDYNRVPTPDIEITTVEDLPQSDDEHGISLAQPTEIIQKEEKVELNQYENNSSTSSPIETHMTNEQEQIDAGLDFAASIPSESASINPFASPESEVSTNIFAIEQCGIMSPAINTQELISSVECTNIFVSNENTYVVSSNEPKIDIIPSNDTSNSFNINQLTNDEFDVFTAKFESAKKDESNLFGNLEKLTTAIDAWGSNITDVNNTASDGFGIEDDFDIFYAAGRPELESPENKEFNVVIRPKEYVSKQGVNPIPAPPLPPPRSMGSETIVNAEDLSLRINPFDKTNITDSTEGISAAYDSTSIKRTDSQETPCTPLYDEDVSQPLEDFPRINYTGPGWEIHLRQPNKKKITGQRFWKKIFIRLIYQGDSPVLQLFNQQNDKEPFQELPLQPSYSVSEIGAQQYDQFGKIFTVKLQYIFYKERPGVRPGQVTKAERITNKLSQFAAYAIQGDYQGVKEFGSDLKKLGLPVEHAPQVSQLFKIGSMSYEDLKQFSVCIEESLFKLPSHRDRALNYKSEEVQITVVDEIYVEQTSEGHVEKQIARVRLFFLAFLSGMPTIELGLNDLIRQGKEVVGRHDIIPVVTEEWIRLEGVEFHSTVQQDEYERSRTIKFQPPDACYIELMRFRVRPPKNRELPLQLKATWCVTGNRVELRADVLVPGFASRKLGQIPCEDVAIRFPIPECWIYLFRVEKHFRYGSVKSAHRRTGKIKGIERILGTVDTLQESLIEVTSGQAKYEHHHRALVWRCPRLPKEGQGAYTTHQLVCRMALTSYDQIPEQLAPYCFVEFTMPATQVSHTTVRSVSVQDSDSDEPPEKYVRYLARHEYRVGIEHTTGESPNAYLAATRIKEESPQLQQIASSPMAPSDSDSESN